MSICQNILFIILLLKFVFYNQHPSCSKFVCDPSQIPCLLNTYHAKIKSSWWTGYSLNRITETPSWAPFPRSSVTWCQEFKSPSTTPWPRWSTDTRKIQRKSKHKITPQCLTKHLGSCSSLILAAKLILILYSLH